MTKIADNNEYFGKRVHIWTALHKNSYVITGLLPLNVDYIADNSVGRVVQVRLKAGAYGSNCVILRHVNGSLIPHENQSFFEIPEQFHQYLDTCFDGVYLDDSDRYEYSLQGEFKESGFLVSGTNHTL